MSLPGRLVDLGGLRLFVHDTGGSGVPLVLIHGWTMSHYMWRHILPALSASHRRLIAFDLPGFGESDRPSPRRFDYSAGGLALTTWRLLDDLGIDRAVLVGHSMGGTVVVHAAALRPGATERAIVIDGGLSVPELPAIANLLRLPFGAGRMALRTSATRGMIARMMKHHIYRDPALADPSWVEYVWERLHRPGGVEAAYATFAALYRPEAAHAALARLTVPLNLIWGEGDQLFPLRVGEATRAGVAGATLDIIPDVGHSPPEEAPEATARVILGHLAGASAA
jgi:pimeloyl-ACP methyl ester carboxylesterase